MNSENQEVLNIVQQVLRNLMVALAAGNKSNLADISAVLHASAENESLDPMARSMLVDLGDGAAALHAAGIRKQ